MSYQKIYNPLEEPVQTGFKGEYFSIQPKETKSFAPEVAAQFLDTYGFLQRVETEEVTPESISSKTEKQVEEVKEVKKTVKK